MIRKAIQVPGYYKGRLPWKGAIVVCFFCFFLFGILLANWVGQENLVQYGMLNDYYLNQLTYIKLDTGAFFSYLLRQRIHIFMMVLILSFTHFGIITILGVIAWSAFSMGYLCVDALVGMGLKGMALVLFSMFPQIIFYALAYLCIARSLISKSSEAVQFKTFLFQKYTKLSLLATSVSCFLLGIWLESYVSPFIIRGFWRKFG